MAEITLDKKALLILAVTLGLVSLALYAAGLFSGMLLREVGGGPDAAALERRIAEVSSKLDDLNKRKETPPPPPAPAPEPAAPKGDYVVQTGAFAVKMNAVNQAAQLKDKGFVPVLTEVKGRGGKPWYVVRLVGYASSDEARRVADGLVGRGIKGAAAMDAAEPMLSPKEMAEAEAPAKKPAPAPPVEAKPAPEPAKAPAAEPAAGPRYSVQVASGKEMDKLKAQMAGLARKGLTPCLVLYYDSEQKPFYAIQIGDFATRAEASAAAEAFKQDNRDTPVIKVMDSAFLAQRKQQCP